MKRFAMATVLVVLAGFAGTALADDKPNPTGTWKYTAEVNGQSFDVFIKLKLEKGKLRLRASFFCSRRSFRMSRHEYRLPSITMVRISIHSRA